MQLLTEIDGEPSYRKAELVMKGGLMLEMRLIPDAVRTPTGDGGGGLDAGDEADCRCRADPHESTYVHD